MQTDVHSIAIYREPCTENYVAVYSASSDGRRRLIRQICGAWIRYQFWTGRKFVYIKFHTGPATNTRRYYGFSKISFYSLGTTVHM